MQSSFTVCKVTNFTVAVVSQQKRFVRTYRGSLRKHFFVKALGSNDSDDRKTLTRENEPEEYWSTKGEREGESPMKDPLAYIGLLAILFPFLFLGVAIALGWVDLAGGR